MSDKVQKCRTRCNKKTTINISVKILSHLILKSIKHTKIMKIGASMVDQRELIADHQRHKILFWGIICWAAISTGYSIQDLIYYVITITLNSVQQ